MERQRFRFYPTEQQKKLFEKEFGCARYAYNYMLKLRTDSFKAGKPINYYAGAAEWTKHRRDPKVKWLRQASCVPQQQALRHLQRAFVKFFTKQSRYPRFKRKRGKQTVTYTLNGFELDPKNRNLTIVKIGRLRIRWSRTFSGTPTSATITKDCSGRYFVTLVVRDATRTPLPVTNNQVGIDLGINRLATLSTGERIANPRFTTINEAKVSRLQRVLSRRMIGSGRYKRQKLKLAKLKARIADSRSDNLHKLTTDLVRRFDVLAIEDLNVAGMIRNRALGKHLVCASFGQFRDMLKYKCAWYGRELRVADRFFPSSKRCNTCGHIHLKMPLNTRQFTCESCGEHHDRDENAAKNILKFAAVGQTVKARGESVSLAWAKARKSCSRRSVNQAALS